MLAAAIPILTLLYFIALHPHRDASGRRYLGISAPLAALCGVVAAFIVAILIMRMPPGAAISAFLAGALNGFIGIIWIIIGGFSIQPGEFAKILLTIFASAYLVTKRDVLSLAGRRFLLRRRLVGQLLQENNG